jgi:hypothetical protein
MFLGIFVTENEFGVTETLGKCLLNHQDADNFEWAFEQFKQLAEVGDPEIFMTDGDLAIAKATSTVFSTSRHLLCCWHIVEKNARKHFRKHLLPNVVERIIHLLWAVVLTDCEVDINQFIAQWKQMVDIIDDNILETAVVEKEDGNLFDAKALNSESQQFLITHLIDSKLKWFNKLYFRKEQFCRRFIISTCVTYDMRSTQRVESINARIDAITSRDASLLDLFRQLTSYDELQFVKYNDCLNKQTKRICSFITHREDIETLYRQLLTHFALRKACSELNSSMQ